ncbi:choline-binding transcriptional repressor BetI [Hoeflea prorocentri]|uniref:HTH-type transcriptional regulator BetI n=1 Tax=Hoeflea prorocentri TaxID=1922333 RepID=A0A9X3UFB7_9HYPH|nr:transcriptional regulator BetI [Hoeflea prorocentri]MCY6379505.1 transcriptional regulator BetI [Hoeflea prorocentri]MDA5397305.1 transcriptional regulator BetI [Hoeflea prorocentri]
MPKVGMEPIRRKSLVEAAISAIHARGSLDITIRDIALRAGVSQGLAHHYFGSKDALIASAMRHLLTEYGRQVRREMKKAHDPRSRVSAIIHASLGSEQFRPETVSVWLVFYVHAQESDEAHALLSVYSRRLRSNLVHGLVPLAGERAHRIAEGIASLIDGLYIRKALGSLAGEIRAEQLVEDYVDRELEVRG